MSTRNPAPDGTEEAARPRTKLPIPPACDICRQSATALAAGIRRRDFSVREVAAAADGTVELEETKGGGLTVVVTLPAAA